MLFTAASGQIEHHFGVGLQMPGTKILDPVSGRNLLPEVYPLTFRYGMTFEERHGLGLTVGGRVNRHMPRWNLNGLIGIGVLRNYDARIDYRWYTNSPESRWQPFVGGGINIGITEFTINEQRTVARNYRLTAQAGLRVHLLDWLYVETELPVRVVLGELGLFGGNVDPVEVLEEYWQFQRNQLWPVFSIGVKL